jgi:hypothetical protein
VGRRAEVMKTLRSTYHAAVGRCIKWKPITLFALAAIPTLAVSSHTADVEDRNEFLAFGLAGITRGQTLRFHVVSIGDPYTATVNLLIYDTEGALLARCEGRILPGHTATLEFPFVDRGSDRVEFYAVMRFVTGRPCIGYIIPTLEAIDDETGKTLFVLGGDSIG